MKRKLLLVTMLLMVVKVNAKFFKKSNDYERHKYYYFNPNTFHPDVCESYNQDNAAIFAKLCNIVYENRKTIAKIILKEKFEFYHDAPQSTEYMFVDLNGYVIICFRGSESLVHFTGRGAALKDWFGSDRIIHIFSPMSEGKHKYIAYGIPNGQTGFRRRTYQMINKNFFQRLDKFIVEHHIDPHHKIYITGHSLGAALAQFIIAPLDQLGKYNIGCVYLFAPPLAIECKEADAIGHKYGKRIHNIIYERDFVVRGQLRGETNSMGYYYRSVADTINRTNRQYIQSGGDIFNTLFGVGYHHLESYIRAIDSSCNATESVNEYRPYPIGDDPTKQYYYPGEGNTLYQPLPEVKSLCQCTDSTLFDPPHTTYRQHYKNIDEISETDKKYNKPKKLPPNKH